MYIEADQLEIIIDSYINNSFILDENITPQLLINANLLEMESLKRKCVDYLIQNIYLHNVMEILISAYRAKERKLATTTWEFVVKNSKDLEAPYGLDMETFFYIARKPLWYASQDFDAVYQLQTLVARSENSDNA